VFEVEAPRARVAEDMSKIERRRVEGEVSQAVAGGDMFAQHHVSAEELQQPLNVSVATSRVMTDQGIPIGPGAASADAACPDQSGRIRSLI